MIRAILFDRDGVLVDSNEVIISAYRITGKKLGLKVPSKDFFRKNLGRTYPEILEKAYGKDKKIVKTYKETWKGKKLIRKIKKMPGLNKLMRKIKLPKALVTAGTLRLTNLLLKNSLKYFQAVITMEDTKKNKPNPEPLLMACKKLNVKPEEAVYVGDTITDYRTAMNAGTKFIGFLSNGAARREFKKAGVKVMIKSLDNLPKALKKLNGVTGI